MRTTDTWIQTADRLPPDGVAVETVDGVYRPQEHPVRKIRIGSLWFFADKPGRCAKPDYWRLT